MKKNIILSLLFFAFGFLTHAFFFPEILSNGISDVSEIALPNAQPSSKPEELRSLTTKVMYDGEHFTKHNVTIEVGTYLMVVNNSPDKLMSLTSNNPLFVTPRGYAQSEAVKEIIETRGQFVIADKNNLKEKLVITVK